MNLFAEYWVLTHKQLSFIIIEITNTGERIMKIKKLNIFAFIAYPIVLFLGFSGLVSWWVILTIALLTIEVNVTFE